MYSKTIHRTSAVVSVAGVLLVAGCASSAKPAAQSTPSAPPATTAAPSATAPPTTAPPTSAGMSATSVSTGMSTVNGTSETVLTAPDGHTLYYFTPDTTAGMATCTASCVAIWPALNFSGTGTPTEPSGVTGMLAAVMNANGDQISYNGHPLYEFSKDTAAGQANGEGVLGKWFVATPTLAAGAGAATPTPAPTTSSGGGYGGGYGNG